jgi:hypothetical protein
VRLEPNTWSNIHRDFENSFKNSTISIITCVALQDNISIEGMIDVIYRECLGK